MKLPLIRLLVCLVICITVADRSNHIWAQSDLLFESIIPASLKGESGRVDFASNSVTSESSDTALPRPLTAAPPPEPETPAWGQFLTPSVPPTPLPAREYNLVGPPRGIIQHSEGQDYQAIVADPNSVLDCDARIGQNVNIFRPDGIAPIGVFGDHTLPTGMALISYRYLQNSYDQNYMGSHRAPVPAAYPFAPTRGMQNSQVALVEYGVTQDFTVLAYLPFQHNEINSQTATGSYQTAFTNPGDIRVQGLLVIARGDRSQQHVNFGLSLPVGFLEQQTVFGTTPAPSTTFPNLPYQVRTSSGTFDVLLGYTYRKQTENWTWGGQINAVIPTGLNTLGYELGNQLQTTSWLSRRWSQRWSTSARLDAHWVQNIRGDDPRLVTTLSPANQPGTQGYHNLNGLLGVNYLLTRPGHRFQEQRFFLESGLPIYQWVDGPQLGLSWIINGGWAMAF